ncbi:cytochrome c oxidase subunit II [Synechococcus sp. CCY 9618]|uniref:cytochrome c oxidase subunit II n=1 Tax=Synechococcus sp. CCY 9618 TaxID=2815602 RepID=UPI001C23A268|nr:cytochrome c oxidase subunit II [Synechococcus sp. CCY 9618]
MTPSAPPARRFPIAALVLIAAALAADGAVSLWMARTSHHWLPVQASAAAPYVDDLFALETGIGSFIFLGCFAVMLWTLLFNRAPKYDMEDGDPIEGNLKLEITWTIIPLVIVMLIAIHAIRVSNTLATIGPKERVLGGEQALQVAEGATATGAAPAAADYGPIEVIARQWSWEFVYPDGTRSGELHLPVDRRVRFKLISMDVLHGFYVPAFRLKQDLIPGSVIDYSLVPTREGRYRLRDSMFSGGYFSTNQTDVVVESAGTFERWLADAARAPLQESPNAALQLWQARLAKGDKGWATVPPAPPPLVNVIHDPTAPHEG